MYNLSDYQYELPEDRIAQVPVVPADQSKLLRCMIDTNSDEKAKCVLEDTHFLQLPDIVSEDDVFFFNDTRVVHARIDLHNVRVVTQQGREAIVEDGEIFFLQKHSEYEFEALLVLLKRTRPGTRILLNETTTLVITELTKTAVKLRCEGVSVDELLKQYGHMPLPPYIKPTQLGEDNYQTMFAKEDGSVAAPTASLHFTPRVIDALHAKHVQTHFVTLHVGIGTFRPVHTDDIRDYDIHEETIILSQELFATVARLKLAHKRIIAVGTTVTRVLETMPYIWYQIRENIAIADEYRVYWDSITADITSEQATTYIASTSFVDQKISVQTKIFIYPGFIFRIVNSLITNFHVPGSSLLMLVAAVMGYENMRLAYDHALSHDYRFLSFGDAMWIENI